jgi:hypothetical protein
MREDQSCLTRELAQSRKVPCFRIPFPRAPLRSVHRCTSWFMRGPLRARARRGHHRWRVNHTQTHTRTRTCLMCVRHKRASKQAGRTAGRYLGASLHYRTGGSSRSERASERRRQRLKTILGTTGSSAKNRCDHPSSQSSSSTGPGATVPGQSPAQP